MQTGSDLHIYLCGVVTHVYNLKTTMKTGFIQHVVYHSFGVKCTDKCPTQAQLFLLGL